MNMGAVGRFAAGAALTSVSIAGWRVANHNRSSGDGEGAKHPSPGTISGAEVRFALGLATGVGAMSAAAVMVGVQRADHFAAGFGVVGALAGAGLVLGYQHLRDS